MSTSLASLADSCPPLSCDTFVVLPPNSLDNCVIFGKNSDRPSEEVQEVLYIAGCDHPRNSKVQCTYTKVDQAARTYSIIITKPSWMWGAESGSNENGVCIGNEAVFSKMLSQQENEEKLLGCDIVRLALERSATAKEAKDIIIKLLETVGVGGRVSDEPLLSYLKYDNSFLISDKTEAWIVETAGQFWATQRVTSGLRNLSNILTIGTDYDELAEGTKEHAEKYGWWDPAEGEFHFAKSFCQTYSEVEKMDKFTHSRYASGREMLEEFSKDKRFCVADMISILKDEPSGINMKGVFRTMSSHVSFIRPPGSPLASCHWLTGTPDPVFSIFKPFVFTDGANIGASTKSPNFGSEDPAKCIPRFRRRVDRSTPLFEEHERVYISCGTKGRESDKWLKEMNTLQGSIIRETEEFINDPEKLQLNKGTKKTLFRMAVHKEMVLYSKRSTLQSEIYFHDDASPRPLSFSCGNSCSSPVSCGTGCFPLSLNLNSSTKKKKQ
ncbi:secernin-3 isoform X1 [Octopus bimaculoides]|nr:secernin-3 isoform X1 [Octopus bimaculoides]XP_052823270.1 secernin-3 isoform X1 [Octopus bimaculoides]|eukprot:XP_014772451.1 PREDICTED: secernin-3-like isoform X1 [Octopus bimaculoides]